MSGFANQYLLEIPSGLKVIALDGHDGAGKSTLGKLVAEELGGRYLHPFSDSLGDLIAWTFKNKRFDLTDLFSRAALRKVYEENADVNLIVFDRHWLSMFTVLPEEYHASWTPLPLTVLCWVDFETTCKRLTERGEEVGDEEEHRFYIKEYPRLAEKHGAFLLDTSKMSLEENKAYIVALAKKHLDL